MFEVEKLSWSVSWSRVAQLEAHDAFNAKVVGSILGGKKYEHVSTIAQDNNVCKMTQM
jgi:hypothetical protein